MRHRVSVLAIAAFVTSAALARAQAPLDEASLKLAHETFIASVKTANLAIIQAMIHPRGLGFFRESERPVQLGPTVTTANVVPAVLTDLGRFLTVPTETVYRVAGPLGVVLMTSQMQAAKGSDLPDRYSRATYVYVAEGGNWKLLSWHGSDAPLKPKK